MKPVIAGMLVLVSLESFATNTYKCIFDSYSDAGGIHKEVLNLTFLVDESADKAYIIGNNGSNEVAHIFRGDGRSFVEITVTGNVFVTTITPDMQAVHSRNSVMFGDLLPSQYYGRCSSQ